MTAALFGYKRLLCLVSFVVSVLCAVHADTTPSGSPALTTDDSDGGYCNTSWTRYNNSCYLLMTEKYNFTEATKSCSDQEAHLVSISNDAENELIKSLRTSDEIAWIGLERQSTSCNGWSCDWMWLDGSQPGYYNWPPFSSPSSSKCASMEPTGLWGNSRTCTSNLECICEGEVWYPTTTPEATTTRMTTDIADPSSTNSRYCPTSWKRHDQSCYLVMTGKYNFTYANEDCICEEGHLVSISDKAENDFVMTLRSSTDPAWIGLFRQTSSCDDLTSCDWMWLDGSQLGYYNWPPGSLSTASQCALIEPSGFWSNGRSCGSKLNFICERDLVNYTPSQETNHSSTYIGVGVSLGIIVTVVIVGLVVYFKRCRSQMKNSMATAAKKKSGDDYENVGMSSSANDLVMPQPSVSIGDIYENTLTTGAPSRPTNHVDVTGNHQVYEEVTHDTTISPEYTRLQFT